MTRGAVRGNNQSLFQEAFAMNTLGKILKDVVLVNHAKTCDWRTLLMTSAAQKRDLERGNGRTRILGRKDVMCPMTRLAPRSKRIALRYCLPMEGFRMLFLLSGMASAAHNRRNLFLMRKLLSRQVSVARNAGE
jgi:hypothetical protein